MFPPEIHGSASPNRVKSIFFTYPVNRVVKLFHLFILSLEQAKLSRSTGEIRYLQPD
jgi:hypothetical protein